MRDPERLDYFYDKLKEIHKREFPDWRFGQFIMNFLAWNGDPFYFEEARMIERINEYVKAVKGE